MQISSLHARLLQAVQDTDDQRGAREARFTNIRVFIQAIMTINIVILIDLINIILIIIIHDPKQPD